MKIANKFDISKIPFYSIIFTVSSDDCCCDWERLYYVEDINSNGDIDYVSYLIIDGSHCSCYDFDSTEWTATEYTFDELKTLVNNWVKNGFGEEKIIAEMIKKYHGIYWDKV